MDRPKIGDRVVFGRRNGERTKGTVIKVNFTKAKVRQDEERGTLKTHSVGTIWTVPFSLMELDTSPAGAASAASAAPPAAPPATPAPNTADKPLGQVFGTDAIILEAIHSVYIDLSPENLTCDGELAQHHVRARRAELERKLKFLFGAFGRVVSEGVVYDWAEKNREKTTQSH